jgi:hypothetical protein
MMSFCPKKVKNSFCSSRANHIGPCSFHLAGHRADEVVHELLCEVERLKEELAKRDAPLEGLSEGPGYTKADVELIERTRGKPYDRLRATVERLDRMLYGQCNACDFCIDGLPCRSRQ